MKTTPLDLSRLKVFPLEERRNLTRLEDILVSPNSEPPKLSERASESLRDCVNAVRQARERDASVILMYGAHLLRNGAALIVDELMRDGWITHVATNGAGTIHDWEFSWFGQTSESVEQNVATGTFGTWAETGRNIHLALLAGGVRGEGYGAALGRFIVENGVILPSKDELYAELQAAPDDPLAAARADLLRALHQHKLHSGRFDVRHRFKHGSILASAFHHGVNATVHPGIGYDIISCHPMFNGAVIGRAAELDFKKF
ncbi:MAG TPA: hypothetical protein VK530_12355, partial [Candidatus Acidoferrum sp.]|nr:hypothetical protein [Candidatus Acidoferrum sp.]